MAITIGTTYYNNPQYLKKFINANFEYVDEIIIVDDGSSDAAANYIQPCKKIKLFRVLKDYGFNSHGCRNLIMKHTSNDWNILMDVDREFMYPNEAYFNIRNKKLQQNVLYRFVAHAGINDSHKSVNDFLIHRDHFFSAGGYDEELIGQRWGDREYFRQLSHFGKEKILYGVDMMLTRKPSNLINQTSPYDKNTTPDAVRLVSQRIMKPDPNKPILTFQWERVF